MTIWQVTGMALLLIGGALGVLFYIWIESYNEDINEAYEQMIQEEVENE